MNLLRLIWLDIKIGIWKKRRYLLLVIVSIICFMVVRNWKSYYEAFSSKVVTLTLADALAMTFKGCMPFGKDGDGGYFAIPFLWLFLVLSLLLLPLDYPVSTLELWGYPYLIEVGKKKWWVSKSIFTIISISIGFFIVIMIHLICSVIFGFSITLQNTDKFYRFIFSEMTLRPDLELTPIGNLVLTVLLPVSGLWATGLIEVLLTVAINVYFAFFVTVAMLVATCVYDFFWMPGNSIMTSRSALVLNAGTKIATQLIINLMICLIVFMLGIILMERWDFIAKKEKQK